MTPLLSWRLPRPTIEPGPQSSQGLRFPQCRREALCGE